MERPSLRQFTLPLDVTVRTCVSDDLPHLEWFGLFTPHREIIQMAYERHQRGENLMLCADANGFPVGQVWIELKKKSAESVGVLWAVRVIPWLQGLGIGGHLIGAAETVLHSLDFSWAEIGVEIHNTEARRLYERLGYHEFTRAQEDYSYMTPEGVAVTVPLDLYLLRKNLGVLSRKIQELQER